MLHKRNARMWTGPIRHTTVHSRGLLPTQPVTFQLHRMRNF